MNQCEWRDNGGCALASHGDLPSLIWRDHDPYAGVRGSEGHEDLHGWNSHHPLLHDAIVKHLPSVIVEVGVWKGRSSIFMGNILMGLTGIALDRLIRIAERRIVPWKGRA